MEAIVACSAAHAGSTRRLKMAGAAGQVGSNGKLSIAFGHEPQFENRKCCLGDRIVRYAWLACSCACVAFTSDSSIDRSHHNQPPLLFVPQPDRMSRAGRRLLHL